MSTVSVRPVILDYLPSSLPRPTASTSADSETPTDLPPIYSSHLTEELLHPDHASPPITAKDAHVRFTIASIRLLTATRSRTLMPFEEWRYLRVPTPLLLRVAPSALDRSHITDHGEFHGPPPEARRLLVLHALAINIQTLPRLDPALWSDRPANVAELYDACHAVDYFSPSCPSE